MALKYPDFAQCKTAAEKLQEDIGGVLCYGLYTPLSDKTNWDERWIEDGAKSFLHWWVETENNIIDTGSAQFGEPAYKVLPLHDKRYVKVGYEIDNIKIPTGKGGIEVRWKTLIPESTVQIVWPTYSEYIKGLIP